MLKIYAEDAFVDALWDDDEEHNTNWDGEYFLRRHWERFHARERFVADAMDDDAPDSDGWIPLPGLFLKVDDDCAPATVKNLPGNMRIWNGIIEYKPEEIIDDTNAIMVRCHVCGELRVRKARRREAASSSAE